MAFKNIQQQGFTLIELFVTVAILSLILAIAIPSFSSFSRAQALKTSAQTTVKSLTNARVEAMTSTFASSTVCWNLNPAAIAFPNGAAGQNIGPGELVVVEGNAPAALGQTITANALASSPQAVTVSDNDADNCIAFDAQGRLNPVGAILGFLFCPLDPALDQGVRDIAALRVEVNPSGRVALKQNTDATGLGTLNCP